MILFNKPVKITSNFPEFRKYSGDGEYTKECSELIQTITGAKNVLLTPSCTHSLELMAILIDVKPGDEIIMPSFTFVSTANAFLLRGAKVKFVDVDPNTMNISIPAILKAVTSSTKAIVAVQYAGSSSDLNYLKDICDSKGIYFLEDAAQSIFSYYDKKHVGTFGQLGAFSFHDTKNIHCGEGGALLINDEKLLERAEILREKGTNRRKFLRGQVDKYTWVDIGSSYLLSDIQAYILLQQLKDGNSITNRRKEIWNSYFEGLKSVQEIELAKNLESSVHNGHLFYIKTKNIEERSRLIEDLSAKGVQSVFHYVPLHSSPYGHKNTEFIGDDNHTSKDSERLLRLPMHIYLSDNDVKHVITAIKSFYSK